MKKLHTVLFDLDGTLTDPAEGITNSVAYALRGMGIEVPPYSELCRLIGPPLLESFAFYYGLHGKDAQRALDLYREYFAPRGIFENMLYPGIPEMLSSLSDAGLTLYIATSKPEPFAIEIARHFKIDRFFKLICGSTLSETRTKKAEVISYLLELTKLDPADGGILMIGDREHDIKGAAANNIPACGVLYGYGTREELEAAGAAYTAKTVTELQDLLLSLR